MIDFLAGQTYSTRSVIDPDKILTFTITERTKKTVFLTENGGSEKMRRIFQCNGVEWCYPLGTYQDAPILRSDRS